MSHPVLAFNPAFMGRRGGTYAKTILARDFAASSATSGSVIYSAAVSALYHEIQIITQGLGAGTADVPEIYVQVSDDGGSTWETGGYVDGYIRGSAFIRFNGPGNPQTNMWASIFGPGGTVSRIFNLDDGAKPHTNTFARDDSNMLARISTLDNASVTHWRLIVTDDISAGYIKVLGVLA